MSGTQLLNFTLDDTSPLIRYTPSPVTSDATAGWTSFCDAAFWRCDEHSAHSTGLDGATFALSFWGTGITLYGNVTLGMNFTLAVDGAEKTISPGSGEGGQVLAKVDGLVGDQHTAIVTAKKGASQSLLTFDRAEVVLGTGTSVTKTYVGANSSSIILGPQPNPPWSSPQTYNGTITPPGVDDTRFFASDKQGATFYHKFQGSAFFWYGPCYTDTCAYTAILDGTANSQPQIFNASVPYGNVIEGCLLYYGAGLSRENGAMHEFLATNAENHWMTLQWLEIWDYQLVGSGSAGAGGGSSNAIRGLSWSGSTLALFMVLYTLFVQFL